MELSRRWIMTKEFWIGLLAGLLIGWLIEWIIDRIYWRKRYRIVVEQLEGTKDDLRQIKGVRKILESRLNQAGIYSFSALAALSQEELERIVGDAKNLADEHDLIKQARKYAKLKKKSK